MILRAAIAVFAASLLAIPQSFAEDKTEPSEWVSLVNLIATPDKYHDKKVFFSAYVTVEFENMSLCMMENSLSSKDCLWLDIDSGPFDSEEDLKRYNGIEAVWLLANRQVASIHGTFNKNDTGHLGGWSGAIKNVTHVYAQDVSIDFTVTPPLVQKRPSGDKSK